MAEACQAIVNAVADFQIYYEHMDDNRMLGAAKIVDLQRELIELRQDYNDLTVLYNSTAAVEAKLTEENKRLSEQLDRIPVWLKWWNQI